MRKLDSLGDLETFDNEVWAMRGMEKQLIEDHWRTYSRPKSFGNHFAWPHTTKADREASAAEIRIVNKVRNETLPHEVALSNEIGLFIYAMEQEHQAEIARILGKMPSNLSAAWALGSALHAIFDASVTFGAHGAITMARNANRAFGAEFEYIRAERDKATMLKGVLSDYRLEFSKENGFKLVLAPYSQKEEFSTNTGMRSMGSSWFERHVPKAGIDPQIKPSDLWPLAKELKEKVEAELIEGDVKTTISPSDGREEKAFSEPNNLIVQGGMHFGKGAQNPHINMTVGPDSSRSQG